jgi:hypothetical protein
MSRPTPPPTRPKPKSRPTRRGVNLRDPLARLGPKTLRRVKAALAAQERVKDAWEAFLFG